MLGAGFWHFFNLMVDLRFGSSVGSFPGLTCQSECGGDSLHDEDVVFVNFVSKTESRTLNSVTASGRL
ncbi:hypothetical protein M758_5G060600 [Ceratodon purpureus]|nr:hypothetical protein M758_5G060600 [Ceratodon purpureus]